MLQEWQICYRVVKKVGEGWKDVFCSFFRKSSLFLKFDPKKPRFHRDLRCKGVFCAMDFLKKAWFGLFDPRNRKKASQKMVFGRIWEIWPGFLRKIPAFASVLLFLWVKKGKKRFFEKIAYAGRANRTSFIDKRRRSSKTGGLGENGRNNAW